MNNSWVSICVACFLNLAHGLDILDTIPALMEQWNKRNLVLLSTFSEDELMETVLKVTAMIPTSTSILMSDAEQLDENSMLVFREDNLVKSFELHRQLTLVPSVSDSWNLRLDSQVIEYGVTRDAILFHDVYSLRARKRRMKQYLGTWSRDQGFTTSRQTRFWNDRTDLRNVTLVASVLDYSPVFFNSANIVTGKGDPKGFLGSILLDLQDMFGFTVKYVKPSDGLWASKDRDGNWNGMSKMMLEGEADLSPSGLAISKERSEAMDFSIPLVKDMVSLWSKTGTSPTLNVWVYIDTFAGTSSFAVIIIVIFLALGFFAIQRAEVDGVLNVNGYCTLLSELAIVALVVAQHDHPIQSARLSAKLLWLPTCWFGFILFAFFAAVLTSAMTIQPPAFKIREFKDILENDMVMVLMKGSIAYNSLAESPMGSTERQIFEETVLTRPDKTLFSEPRYILQVITENPKYVFFSNMFVFHEHAEVKFNVIKDAYKTPLAFAFQKDSEFLELFNSALANFDEKGILRKNRLKWLGDLREDKDDVISAEATSLGYDNVNFPFIICSLGVGFAVVFAMTEKLRYSMARKWTFRIN